MGFSRTADKKIFTDTSAIGNGTSQEDWRQRTLREWKVSYNKNKNEVPLTK
jgi:hypothetical protein